MDARGEKRERVVVVKDDSERSGGTGKYGEVTTTTLARDDATFQPLLYYHNSYFSRFFWLVRFDQVKLRQVNTGKRLVFDVPFLEFPLRKPQMQELQAILHLRKKKFQLI